jgi:hypothetical protein
MTGEASTSKAAVGASHDDDATLKIDVGQVHFRHCFPPIRFLDTTIRSRQPVQKPAAVSSPADICHASGQTIAFPWNKQECKARPQLFF